MGVCESGACALTGDSASTVKHSAGRGVIGRTRMRHDRVVRVLTGSSLLVSPLHLLCPPYAVDKEMSAGGPVICDREKMKAWVASHHTPTFSYCSLSEVFSI